MSIVYVGVHPECIVLVGDGVSYDTQTGCVAQHVAKLHLFPELHCAMGFTGVGSAGRLFAVGIEGKYRSFDDLLDHVVADLRQLHIALTWNPLLFQREDDKKMSVALAGWSDRRQRLEAYRVVSYEKDCIWAGEQAPAMPAWTLLPLDYVWASMMPDAEHCERLGVLPEKCGDLMEFGVRLVCAGRASSGEMPDADGGKFNVGGFVQVAYVTPGCVQSWIEHRWPEDEVGKPIDPTKGLPLPQWIIDKDAAAGTVGVSGPLPPDMEPGGESFSGAVAA